MSDAPIKLLIVDDDEDYARLLVECFTGLGFQVVYVDSGQRALQEVRKLLPGHSLARHLDAGNGRV